jgi:hypothetical protein
MIMFHRPHPSFRFEFSWGWELCKALLCSSKKIFSTNFDFVSKMVSFDLWSVDTMIVGFTTRILLLYRLGYALYAGVKTKVLRVLPTDGQRVHYSLSVEITSSHPSQVKWWILIYRGIMCYLSKSPEKYLPNMICCKWSQPDPNQRIHSRHATRSS